MGCGRKVGGIVNNGDHVAGAYGLGWFAGAIYDLDQGGATGGDGLTWAGNSTTYAGGGGGGTKFDSPPAGGSGGGGAGGSNVFPETSATSATNYGSGGGGADVITTSDGGDGYQGIVIFKYQYQ